MLARVEEVGVWKRKLRVLLEGVEGLGEGKEEETQASQCRRVCKWGQMASRA